MNQKVLTLDDLLQKKPRRAHRVAIPEQDHGAIAYILAPTPDQLDLAQTQWTNYRKANEIENVGFSKFIVTWALASENNVPLVDPGDVEDELSPEFLQAMEHFGSDEGLDSRAFKRLFDKAMEAFGFSSKDLEELEKNSAKTRTAAGSGSKRKQPASDAKPGSAGSKIRKK